MSEWTVSAIFGVGLFFLVIGLSHFHWEMVKRNKTKAQILRRVEELHKACTS